MILEFWRRFFSKTQPAALNGSATLASAPVCSTVVDPVFYQFRATVERHFSYLFSDYGFSIIGDEAWRSCEYQMLIASRPDCQIQCSLEQDAFEVYFGRPAAIAVFGGGTGWYHFASLLAAEDTLHPSQLVQPVSVAGDASLDATIECYAKLLKAYLPRLIGNLFSPARRLFMLGFMR